MSTPPNKIWLYRITHYQNIPHILQYGLVTANSKNTNAAFVSIGDNSLIQTRKKIEVTIAPFGNLSDYIPFYFGPHSPMLLQIKTGDQGVTQRPQSEIVYLISSLNAIEQNNCKYIFFDGHAWDKMSLPYSNKTDLDKIEWSVVKGKQWNNTEEHIDRKRRKQAELLVHSHVPITCIEHIVAYDKNMYKFVQAEISKRGLKIATTESQKIYY